VTTNLGGVIPDPEPAPSTPVRPSPLALTVLALLVFEPLHPYGMQRLIRQWGKDKVVNVGQRANLYKTIKRLLDAGLVAVRQTERDHQYPERTVYEITPAGVAVAMRWLRHMVAAPRNEFPEFPAALSFLMALGPDGARQALEERAAALAEMLAGHERDLRDAEADGVPRVASVETEYVRAMTAAELAWVTAIVDELRAGTLSWDLDSLEAAAGPYRSG